MPREGKPALNLAVRQLWGGLCGSRVPRLDTVGWDRESGGMWKIQTLPAVLVQWEVTGSRDSECQLDFDAGLVIL